jgi:amidohydrolase
MIALRKQIHQCPEPAYEEVETAAAIVDCLGEIEGMEITTGVGKTGVVALLGGKKKGPCIALRADMDCLRMEEKNRFPHASRKKGMMHGCGHDGHIACLVGAALVLGTVAEKLQGPVKFIFQPGEENAAGAREMIKDGALVDPVPRAIFGLHGTPSLPLGKIGLRSGPMMAASRYFQITVSGRGTHAAMPHKGIDTVLAASQIVCAAHTIVSRNINPLEAALISIPKFDGAQAPNVIPAEVNLEGTLRALSHTTRDFLEKRLTEVVMGTAKAFGADAVIEFDGGYPLLENDQKCFEYVAAVAEQAIGRENIRCDYPPSLGAEDFAFYLEHVPGAFWWLGLGVPGKDDIPLHNPGFDFNDDAIGPAITMHCLLVMNAHLLG